LRLSRNSKCLASQEATREFANSILDWRCSLPEDLLPSRVTVWSSDNVWILILLAMSYRLECVFYRTVREHSRGSDDQEAVTWYKQQLLSSIFELDTLLNRAVVHELVQFAPSSLYVIRRHSLNTLLLHSSFWSSLTPKTGIICASNLLAFQIEVALDPTSSLTQKVTAKARIHAGLSYLRDVSKNWRIAKWTLRVSELVVHRACLSLTEVENGSGVSQPMAVQQPINAGERGWNNDNNFDDNFPFDPEFNIDEVFPEPWVQDFIGENFFGQLDLHSLVTSENASATVFNLRDQPVRN
jgi:hypothetical protein